MSGNNEESNVGGTGNVMVNGFILGAAAGIALNVVQSLLGSRRGGEPNNASDTITVSPIVLATSKITNRTQSSVDDTNASNLRSNTNPTRIAEALHDVKKNNGSGEFDFAAYIHSKADKLIKQSEQSLCSSSIYFCSSERYNSAPYCDMIIDKFCKKEVQSKEGVEHDIRVPCENITRFYNDCKKSYLSRNCEGAYKNLLKKCRKLATSGDYAQGLKTNDDSLGPSVLVSKLDMVLIPFAKCVESGSSGELDNCWAMYGRLLKALQMKKQS